MGQLKKQQKYCEEIKQIMELSFKRVIEQLNKKLTMTDKQIAELGEGNMIAMSSLDLFKQITAKQFEELTAKVDSQHQDRLEQSGYDLNLGQELLSKQFAEEMEARHQA